jgi:hypothetical protein
MKVLHVSITQVSAPVRPSTKEDQRSILVRTVPSKGGATEVELRGTDILFTKSLWNLECDETGDSSSLEFVLMERSAGWKSVELAKVRIPISWITSNTVIRESFHMKSVVDDMGDCTIFVELHRNENGSEPFGVKYGLIAPRASLCTFTDDFQTKEFTEGAIVTIVEKPVESKPTPISMIMSNPLSFQSEERRDLSSGPSEILFESEPRNRVDFGVLTDPPSDSSTPLTNLNIPGHEEIPAPLIPAEESTALPIEPTSLYSESSEKETAAPIEAAGLIPPVTDVTETVGPEPFDENDLCVDPNDIPPVELEAVDDFGESEFPEQYQEPLYPPRSKNSTPVYPAAVFRSLDLNRVQFVAEDGFSFFPSVEQAKSVYVPPVALPISIVGPAE